MRWYAQLSDGSVTVMLTASPVLGKCPAPRETKWGQMTCADESWPRDMLGRAGHPSQCYDGLAAGQKCRQRVSEMLETRDDSNDRILHEVSRESRDPERPAGDDEERAAGHSRQCGECGTTIFRIGKAS